MSSKTGIPLGKHSTETFIISRSPKLVWGSAQSECVQPPGHLGFPGLTFSIFQILVIVQNRPARNGPAPLHKGDAGSYLPAHGSGKGDKV